ncbi:conserved hypothetical protein [Pseudomonas sp. 8Z]|uniref:PA3371 family protein n=1 Tax=Pseudomonas sp. 8Z TaxID=2653166 RepID=UPI0012F22A0E|nr:PA3371 family protein [Pseudomonas sp. 8Z]VXD03895.1 conserved hypothetical protein [Pseudomonas sp. 8Z]
MSKSAIVLLTMTLLSLSLLWLVPELQTPIDLALKCTSGAFAIGFLAALMVGRRFKFDPVLR